MTALSYNLMNLLEVQHQIWFINSIGAGSSTSALVHWCCHNTGWISQGGGEVIVDPPGTASTTGLATGQLESSNPRSAKVMLYSDK